jgi:hypothetical protein
MADQANRGGKTAGSARQPGGKKHQGVRPGSTATAKERHNKAARRKVVPNK